MIVFVNTPLSDSSKAYFRQHLPTDFEVIFKKDLPETEQAAAFRRADFVLGNPPAAWFSEGHNLKWWQLDSAGFDAYKAVQLNAPVTNMGDYFAWPCAETIVAGIMAFYRDIHELAVLQTQKKWVGVPLRFKLHLLKDKKVIILGAGTIGQAVRQMLTGFQCAVKMLARTNPEAELHTPEELKAALPETDLVINCLPGTAKGFFSAELINAMKPGSLYANIGRGSTTDEKALIEALQRGHLAGAVLDVTEVEPLPIDNPLWEMTNVILTQHTGGGQATEDQGKMDLFLQNLERFRTGQPLENQVELSKGY
ncbi:phosphoglycerate dehydrogenase-like enzyme [Larkinella arboricola]|uniref:Phosphoglycerate dehydrogenase-like enzyme n=1 Tax=Larkinella arboricola TaxID=643671 RepID=A0A327WVW1_LARAB|nr:D-2-hydroxyacid dehydrogenase [Larkinella arboricola]RAJ97422.1 phosphoglycerate dehydrogenase-like enzyme [Larkinella arboricola]